MRYPEIDDSMRLKLLEPPRSRIRAVLDTDAYNQIDDQFAIAYALSSFDRLDIEAIYAAPFLNKRSKSAADGMEKSYQEIIRVLSKMERNPDGFVFCGSKEFLSHNEKPCMSEAVEDLIHRALSTESQPLYVIAIGAATNIASAILMEPRIIKKIVVVWLCGHALHWENAYEFNLRQDILASKTVFDCGVPLVHVPCIGTASHMLTTLSELEQYLKGKSKIAEYVLELFRNFTKDHFGFAKELWDVAAVAYLVNHKWVPARVVHSPIITDQLTWSFDNSRHLIKSAVYVKRNEIFRDLFNKLSRC